MRSLHIDTARTWRGGQNQVRLTVGGLRAAGHDVLLLAHVNGELARRAEAEHLPLETFEPRSEFDVQAAWAVPTSADQRADSPSRPATKRPVIVSHKVPNAETMN